MLLRVDVEIVASRDASSKPSPLSKLKKSLDREAQTVEGRDFDPASHKRPSWNVTDLGQPLVLDQAFS